MTEVKRYQADWHGMFLDLPGRRMGTEERLVVLASDFDRVTAERDAERRRADIAVADANDAEAAGKKVSELLANRAAERDAALGRIQFYVEGLTAGNEKIKALQQRLTAADERADVLEGLLRQAKTYGGLTPKWHDAVEGALKLAEGGGDEA